MSAREGRRRIVHRSDFPSAAVKRLLATSAPAEGRVGADAVVVAKRATEQFVKTLGRRCLASLQLCGSKTVKPAHLRAAVEGAQMPEQLRLVLHGADAAHRSDLPVAAMLRVFKAQGVERVDEASKRILAALAEEYVKSLGALSWAVVSASKRKTLKDRDVLAMLRAHPRFSAQ